MIALTWTYGQLLKGLTERVRRVLLVQVLILAPTRELALQVSDELKRITRKRQTFKAALAAGVKMCFGGDVGVYAHGDNVRELELMVEWGMTPAAAVVAATSGNATYFRQAERIGRVKPALFADAPSNRRLSATQSMVIDTQWTFFSFERSSWRSTTWAISFSMRSSSR